MSFYAREVYTGPAASYAFSFPSISKDNVKLYVAGVEDTERTVNNYNSAGGGEVVPSVTPGASDEVVVVRETSRTERLVDYTQPSVLPEEDLDTDSLQAFFMAQESIDQANVATATAEATTEDITAAQAASEAAQALAEAARDAAVIAQSAAELAETGAETAESDAQGYANQAAISAALAQSAADAVANPFFPAGTLDASGGSYPSSPAVGAMYRVEVAGTISSVDYAVGDWAAYTSTGWYKFDNTDPTGHLSKAGDVMSGALDMAGNEVQGAILVDAVAGGAFDMQGNPLNGIAVSSGVLTSGVTNSFTGSEGSTAYTLTSAAATTFDFASASGKRYDRSVLLTLSSAGDPVFLLDGSATNVKWLTGTPAWTTSTTYLVEATVWGGYLLLSGIELP